MKNKKIYILTFLIFIAISLWFYNNQADPSKIVMKEIKNKLVENNVYNSISIESKNVENSPRLDEIKSLQKINGDIRGILTISDTNIDYPLVQGEDNDFYLYKDINKKSNKNGSIYIDYECILEEAPNNLIIYGHNMKNSNMFSDLIRYKDESFFTEHGEIFLYLENEVKTYKVLGAFVLDLTDLENYFYFNSFIHNDEKMNSKSYVEEVEKRSEFFNQEEIPEDANLITLSTCTYESNNARFIVVGIEKGQLQKSPPKTGS